MNAPILITLLAILVLFVLFVVAVGFLAYIATGSPDCNGDPERDAGWTDHEIEELSRSWDRGSHETESRPNLEYVRRRNRDAMRPDCFPLTSSPSTTNPKPTNP